MTIIRDPDAAEQFGADESGQVNSVPKRRKPRLTVTRRHTDLMSSPSPAPSDGDPVRPGSRRRTGGRPAAFFDLDKTIIAKSSALAFSRSFYAGGLINRRSVLRSTYAQFVFLIGGADHDQMEKMREYLSRMVTGWPVDTVREIVADTLHNIVDPLVYDEAVSLIEEHHLAGRDVIIVSASGAEMVEPIGELLGVDAVIATQLAIEDGRYTGEIEFYAYAENKASAIEELAALRGYDLDRSYAYSDSITDVHMLEVVGHPHAVNPDKELRRVARENGWPVLVFNRPVALASRVRLPSTRASMAALAAGTALVVGTAIYLGARRHLVRALRG
jgi:HAD superfamily hydrolase (TIGR01490 family)